MRKYETFFIMDPDLPDDVVSAADDKLKSVVAANQGEVLTYASWGKKKLAYPVKKRTRGHYILMEYIGGPKLVAELERNMRLDERVLKFITVLLDERYDPEKEKKEAAEAVVSPPEFEEGEEGGLKPAEAGGEDEDLAEDSGDEQA